MNRFDRVTSLWLLLQTRPVVTAAYLAEHFGVSERTIYRDIRTLETAGVPIGAEAGVGYFLEKSYRLPPVSFTLDEASALLLSEKLVTSSLDTKTLKEFGEALSKIRAVIDHSEKDRLSSLEDDVAVLPPSHPFPTDASQVDIDASPVTGAHAPEQVSWLRECRIALMQRQVVDIVYLAQSRLESETRAIEPIGLFYYSWHWHLISWCRLREDYRDFRLDRIQAFAPREEQFNRHSRLSLKRYLAEKPGMASFQEIVVRFSTEAARFVDKQRYLFGFTDERVTEEGVQMRFLTSVPDYLARWLLQFLDQVEVVSGDELREAMDAHSRHLASHWSSPSQRS